MVYLVSVLWDEGVRSNAVMRVNASCYSVKMGSLSLVWRGRSTLESLAPAMRTGTQDAACWPQPLVRTRWSWWAWRLKSWVYCWCTYHCHHACWIVWPFGFLCWVYLLCGEFATFALLGYLHLIWHIRVTGAEGSWPRLMALVTESSKYSVDPKFVFSRCSFSPVALPWDVMPCNAFHTLTRDKMAPNDVLCEMHGHSIIFTREAERARAKSIISGRQTTFH